MTNIPICYCRHCEKRAGHVVRRFRNAWGYLKKKPQPVCQKRAGERKSYLQQLSIAQLRLKSQMETLYLHTPHCDCQDYLRCRLSLSQLW